MVCAYVWNCFSSFLFWWWMDVCRIQTPFIGPYRYRFQLWCEHNHVGDKRLCPRPPLLPVLLSHHDLRSDSWQTLPMISASVCSAFAWVWTLVGMPPMDHHQHWLFGDSSAQIASPTFSFADECLSSVVTDGSTSPWTIESVSAILLDGIWRTNHCY